MNRVDHPRRHVGRNLFLLDLSGMRPAAQNARIVISANIDIGDSTGSEPHARPDEPLGSKRYNS